MLCHELKVSVVSMHLLHNCCIGLVFNEFLAVDEIDFALKTVFAFMILGDLIIIIIYLFLNDLLNFRFLSK